MWQIWVEGKTFFITSSSLHPFFLSAHLFLSSLLSLSVLQSLSSSLSFFLSLSFISRFQSQVGTGRIHLHWLNTHTHTHTHTHTLLTVVKVPILCVTVYSLSLCVQVCVCVHRHIWLSSEVKGYPRSVRWTWGHRVRGAGPEACRPTDWLIDWTSRKQL